MMGHMLQRELRKPKWGAGQQRQGKEKAKIVMHLVKEERRQETERRESGHLGPCIDQLLVYKS